MNKGHLKKTIMIAAVVIASAVVLAAVINVIVMLLPASVNYGTSRIYTHDDMEKALEAVSNDFAHMEGCKLFALNYAGDERSLQELEYVNEKLNDSDPYTECIVFDSVFHPPIFSSGIWDHHMYYWSWILVRTNDSEWKVVSKGYC